MTSTCPMGSASPRWGSPGEGDVDPLARRPGAPDGRLDRGGDLLVLRQRLLDGLLGLAGELELDARGSAGAEGLGDLRQRVGPAGTGHAHVPGEGGGAIHQAGGRHGDAVLRLLLLGELELERGAVTAGRSAGAADAARPAAGVAGRAGAATAPGALTATGAPAATGITAAARAPGGRPVQLDARAGALIRVAGAVRQRHGEPVRAGLTRGEGA